MSHLSANEKKQIKELIIVLNSSDLFKYPFGNKKLHDTTKEFESIGYIKFNELTKKWSAK